VVDAVDKIAQAVLYEGYILWPYRRSALKNQQRWTFGGVYPELHSKARGGDDPWVMQTQVLLRNEGAATVSVGVRFLHVVERTVCRVGPAGLEPVDELEVGGERHVSWDEAVERELRADGLVVAALGEAPAVVPIAIPEGREEEPLVEPDGRQAGAIVRRYRSLAGSIEIAADGAGDRLARLTVRIANTTPWPGGRREDALRQTLCSTHTVLEAANGEFVSLTDPPADLLAAAERCENIGTWPVLVGEEGDRHTLLSSPIILSDYPQIAPESPGDLFDGGEIDQLLILNILSLTPSEQEEMRASDPRAREILDRCAALTPEELMRLHGAIREFRPSVHG
jgi:hypothetical protein